MAILVVKKFAQGQVEHGMPLGTLDTEAFSQVLRGDRILPEPEELRSGDVLELATEAEHGQYRIEMISAEAVWLKLLSVVPASLGS